MKARIFAGIGIVLLFIPILFGIVSENTLGTSIQFIGALFVGTGLGVYLEEDECNEQK